MNDLSTKKLGVVAVALIALAVISLMGIAVVNGYSKILREETSTAVNNLQLPAANATGLVGASGTYPFLQALTGCTQFNSSNVLSTANYTISEGTSDGGFITLGDTVIFGSSKVNCTTLTYLADTTEQGSADDFVTGIAVFASFSAVIALAIIGRLIVGLFRRKQ